MPYATNISRTSTPPVLSFPTVYMSYGKSHGVHLNFSQPMQNTSLVDIPGNIYLLIDYTSFNVFWHRYGCCFGTVTVAELNVVDVNSVDMCLFINKYIVKM